MAVETLLKVILAAALGGIIGLERELSHKEAGLRTNILIAVGSTFFTILSFKLAEGVATSDPTRIAAQIVTGIGFLGAGAIIQARFAVHGLTTAATVWTVAAIGMGVGSGHYIISFLVTLLVVVTLTLFKYIANTLEKQQKVFAYSIKTEEKAAILIEIKKIIKELGIHYLRSAMGKREGGFLVDLVLTTSENKNKEFIEKTMQLDGIEEVSSESL